MKLLKYFIQLISIVLIVSCSKANVKSNGESLVIATFNVEWLGDGIDDLKPRSQQDYARIADVLLNMNADVIGLQEVENEAALNYLIQFMPDYDFYITNDGYKQRNAVLIKRNVTVIEHKNFNDLIVKQNRTRPGLLLNLKKDNFDFYLMVVHLKSTSRYDSTELLKTESFDLRAKQAVAINDWVNTTLATSTEKDLIIIGDFNDNPNNVKPRGNIEAIKNNPNLQFLTADLPSCKNPKWNNIDHIVLSTSAKTRYIDNSINIYNTYTKYNADEVKMISDHCPCMATFDTKLPDND